MRWVVTSSPLAYSRKRLWDCGEIRLGAAFEAHTERGRDGLVWNWYKVSYETCTCFQDAEGNSGSPVPLGLPGPCSRRTELLVVFLQEISQSQRSEWSGPRGSSVYHSLSGEGRHRWRWEQVLTLHKCIAHKQHDVFLRHELYFLRWCVLLTARKLSMVGKMPGANVKSYSGYFTVNKTFNSNLFFWFFPAQMVSSAASSTAWHSLILLCSAVSKISCFFVVVVEELKSSPHYSPLIFQSTVIVRNPFHDNYRCKTSRDHFESSQWLSAASSNQ